MLEYELYLFADPAFYDSVSRWEASGSRLESTERPTPEGWQRAERGDWISLRPAAAVLPAQGWKVHVGALPDNADRVCRAVWDYCVANGFTFKFLRNRSVLLALSSKYAPRTASGKFITIYPPDEAALRQLLTELGQELSGEPAAHILSDLRWGSGPLFVRYGGFVEQVRVAEDGRAELAITGPDGELYPDRRRPVFETPSWVSIPDFLVRHRDVRHVDSGGQLPYRVERALHFSNGGGVYLATRVTDGARVVLKEARPLAGLDGNGQDATSRLRQERWALQQLAGVPGVPAYHDYLRVGEHEFLVEEYVDGEPLPTWLGHEYPLVAEADPDPERLADYTTRALRVYDDLRALIARLHDRGVVFADLHPGNVIVRVDGSVALLDFELSHSIGDNRAPGLRAAGFADVGLRGAALDRRALAAIGLWLFLPLNRVLALAPEKVGEYLDYVADRFGVPTDFAALLRDELARGPAAGPACGGAGLVVRIADPTVDWSTVRRSMAAAVALSGTPERTDRLFPGDISQFNQFDGGALGLAHGAGGVLWALSVTGHGRYPSHEDWLMDAVARATPRQPGFYDGLHGLAYLADHFGRDAEAHELVERAMAASGALRSVDLYGGLAGAGLNLLHFAGRSGDTRFSDAAHAAADRIAEALDLADGDRLAPPPTAGAGLLRGWSGAALFLGRLAADTGDKAYLDLAVRAVHRDLDACVLVRESLLVEEPDVRTLPYLDVGSAGIALVIDELLDTCSDDRLAASLPPLVRACATEFVLEPNLFRGRAGLLATVSRVGARLEPDYRRLLSRHLKRLAWHAVSYRGHLAFPGYHLLRLSMDLASGTAGVLVGVHSATAGSAGFLPFFDTRRGGCRRGAAPATQTGPAARWP